VLSSHPKTIPQKPKRIIVALTGATGTVLGIRLLQRLRELNVETHLIISKWAAATLKYETSYTLADVQSLASKNYSYREQSATISSGSVVCGFEGMVIVPCSMKTLAGVRVGYAEDLISRAADVVLKERRKLVMVVRETPLSAIHLENMLSLTRMGAVMFPPVPAFYTRPETLEEVVEQSVGRILDCFGIETGEFDRWDGFGGPKKKEKKEIERDERRERDE
jgi:4-hydroxy-3-polyprenylbenzoate decarboxylase